MTPEIAEQGLDLRNRLKHPVAMTLISNRDVYEWASLPGTNTGVGSFANGRSETRRLR